MYELRMEMQHPADVTEEIEHLRKVMLKMVRNRFSQKGDLYDRIRQEICHRDRLIEEMEESLAIL